MKPMTPYYFGTEYQKRFTWCISVVFGTVVNLDYLKFIKIKKR